MCNWLLFFQVGGSALLRSGMSLHSFQVVARAGLAQVLQSWQTVRIFVLNSRDALFLYGASHCPFWQFCNYFAVMFRSETCCPTVTASLKLLSSRLTSILDDCCGSIEQLKHQAAVSFPFNTQSSHVKFSSPTISQFIRLACSTAATTARMLASANPPSVPHALAAQSLQTLIHMKVQLICCHSFTLAHFSGSHSVHLTSRNLLKRARSQIN
jgi:hypothetical protein